MVLQKDKRLAKRHELHYDIVIIKGVMLADQGYRARILDASKEGMRLFLAGIPPLPVGAELQLSCVPARYFDTEENWSPVKMDCRIVWRNLQNNTYGVSFM